MSAWRFEVTSDDASLQWLVGRYYPETGPSCTHHGRPWYYLGAYVGGDRRPAVLYFWDPRYVLDGSRSLFEGWWFGMEVGGDEVFAHLPGTRDSPADSTRWVRFRGDGVVPLQLSVRRCDHQASGRAGVLLLGARSPFWPDSAEGPLRRRNGARLEKIFV